MMIFGLIFLSAALLWAAFPPFGIGLLAFVALIPLFIVLDKATSWRVAFGRAYLMGFVFFMAALAWLRYVSTFGDWLAWLGLVLLSLYLALYMGCFGVAYYHFRQSRLFWLVIPAVWVVLEYARGTLLTGFNWGSLGHSQAGTPLVAWAAFTGVAGVSFLVTLGALLLKNAAQELISFRRAGRSVVWFVVFVLLLGFLTLKMWWMTFSFRENAVVVAVIQPNIRLEDNWDPLQRESIVRRSLELSRQTLREHASLIVWPETSFPGLYGEQPELVDEVKAFARESRMPVLIGSVKRHDGKYYNAAILIDADGVERGWVAKRHLVIFGEYIPLRDFFPFLAELAPIDDFTPGPEDAILTLPDGTKAGILLCFEDTVPYLSRRYAARGADILINMTNDAWFRDAGQQRMHLNNALFRAVENGLSLARATNTGESCGVERSGHVKQCVAGPDGRRVGIEGVTILSLPVGRHPTFYTKYGEVFTGACFAVIMFSIITVYRRRRGVK